MEIVQLVLNKIRYRYLLLEIFIANSYNNTSIPLFIFSGHMMESKHKMTMGYFVLRLLASKGHMR